MATTDSLQAIFLIADKFRAIDDHMMMRQIQVFLFLAMREGNTDLTQEEIAEALELPQNSVSKYINRMAKLGLVTYSRDPNNDARKVVSLAAKGKKLLHDINTIIKG